MSDDEGVFALRESIDIVSKEVGLKVHIPAEFLMKVDGVLFVHLDFYQSRGVYTMMACRSGKDTASRPANLSMAMRSVCADIRRVRDREFRSMVVRKSDGSKAFGACVMPRNKGLRAIALAQDDVNQCTLPAVEGVTDEVECDILHVSTRTNRHSKLWVKLACDVIDYISKVVSHKFDLLEQSGNGDNRSGSGGGDAGDGEELPNAHESSHAISLIDGNSASRSSLPFFDAKGQSSLNAFFSKKVTPVDV